MKTGAAKLATWITAGSLLCTTAAMAAENVVIVYDASGSMWGQIDGTSKVEIARDVMADLVERWDPATRLGLVAYGHRTKGDCGDIETLIAPGPMDKDAFVSRVNDIRPVGKTPLSAAVQHAADLLSYRDTPATVVLISDGVETCNADPCALSAQLAQQGVRFKTHVVGFDVEDEAQAGLACIAENTGGVFVPARNAAELTDALNQVREAMTTPEPDPEPDLPQIGLTVPAEVTTGAVFDFSWTGTINGRDFLTIVPAGAEEREIGNHIRAKEDSDGRLTAPGTPGLYELRYILEEGRRVLARQSVEVVESEIGLTVPAEVTTGAVFDFSWTGTINGRDFLTIVPAGAEEREIGNHIRAKEDSDGRLTAPGTPGLYELRYILEEGRRVLARQSVEVVESEIGLTVPAEVTTGAVFDFSWTGTINGRDFLTIVPAGAEEREIDNHIRAKEDSDGRLTAPGTPGLYELRYILEEGRRVLARQSVEVVESEIGLTVPAEVTTGAVFDFSWTGTINGRDFLTIVPAGAEEREIGNHIRAKEDSDGRLTAPGTSGLYELRYILEEGRRVLARATVEVTTAEIGISGPGTVRAGADVDVTWSSTVNSSDFITIVPAGADSGTIDAHIRTRSATEGRLEAPKETGLYEIRYILEEGRVTLASATLEVVAADATLDDGAAISAPAEAAVGSTITVSWTGGGSGQDQRISLARKDQTDFSWISAQKIGADKSMEVAMPEKPGLYELRFVDVSEQAILGRAVVKVE